MNDERPGDDQLSHRDRKKLQTKRRIHATALSLAKEQAYGAITVESIAARSDVSASTIYRYFSTKGGVFLWDEYDDAVMSEFQNLLGEHDPIEAMTKAVHMVLAGPLHLDRDRALSQLVLIDGVEPLKQSMAAHLDELRKSMAAMVVESGWPPLEANVFAGAVMGAFKAAIETWVEGEGKESLTWLFDRAIGLLGEGFDSGPGRSPSTHCSS